MAATHPETVVFLGASGGVGLSALKHVLATGRKCVALCRTPAKLAAILPPEANPNLDILQGNAHDVTAVSRCLLAHPGELVDYVVSTIGSVFVASKMNIEDPLVCSKGMSVLLEALTNLRRDGAVGNPHIISCSTTGISRFGRDIPIAMILPYRLLKSPHEDKVAMEDHLVASDENYTIVRPSLMLSEEETTKTIRVGLEDAKTGRESVALGYSITKGDAGRWIAQNLVLKKENRYNKKIAMITT
ncbi:hypothetical protein F5Y19DRAFT_439808 [Xylariaceae sp. FL1651]|nr:hypothetical protein F5Y19DRAFT_439808 [Xylariaceae sp. FL1651]